MNTIRASHPFRAVLCAILVAACAGTPTATPRPAATGSGSPAPSIGQSPSPMPSASASSPVVATSTPTPITLFGALPTTALDRPTSKRLQDVLDQIVSEGAPDAIAAVVTAKGTWAGAAGVDGPNNRPATPTDMANIASVSKVFLAALVLRLAEQGRIDLDAPLSKYLPGLSVNSNGATVRQALAMRSGIGDTAESVRDRAYSHCDHAWTRDEVLATIPEPSAPAGSENNYSNPTYKLLGYAAEHASGQPLDQALDDLVIKPTGDTRILLQGPRRATPKPWALPITAPDEIGLADFGKGGTLPCLGISTLALGGAGMAADAPSVARWGWQLFAGKVIGAQMLDAMTTIDRDGTGLGIEQMYEFSPDVALGHTGTNPGYGTILVVLPKRQISIAVVVNEEQADSSRYARLLLAALGY